MHLIPFLILCAAAVAAFLDWYVNSTKRFASVSFALFLFIVGVILVFVLTGNPTVSLKLG